MAITDEVPKNELELLLSQFVDVVVNIAENFHQQTKFYYIAEDEDSEEDISNAILEFLSSYFVSTNENYKSLEQEIQLAMTIVEKIRNKNMFSCTIAPLFHNKNVVDLMCANRIVAVTVRNQFVELKEKGCEVYKEAEKVLSKFRALLLEFNAIMFRYRDIHPDTKLKPLSVSTDIKLDI
jgi:hypothetical protein